MGVQGNPGKVMHFGDPTNLNATLANSAVPGQNTRMRFPLTKDQRPGDRRPQRKRLRPQANRYWRSLEALLRGAGITLNGPQQYDPQVHNERFCERALREGGLGLGESYVAEWWDCDQLDELACRVLTHNLLAETRNGWRARLSALQHRLFNLQTRHRAPLVARFHYDMDSSFFEQMLGPTMAYSCGYWRHAASLDQAQRDKHDLICRKLQIDQHDRVLDIGCGWGAFAKHAAETYGCRVIGITISQSQYDYAREFCAGLPVDIYLYDYRDEPLQSLGRFDKIASVGMFEHVGRKNHRSFMSTAHELLTNDGLFLLHAIGACDSTAGSGSWVERYIFPNSELPHLSDVVQAIKGLFVMEDWHNFGADYDRTLMSWHTNIERHKAAREFLNSRQMYRRWRYYLLTCAGTFRARSRTQLWQVVLSKRGVRDGYVSVR